MKLKIGIINSEFFREDLGGYGGYGSLAKYLSEKYNTHRRSPFQFKIFLIHSHEEKRVYAHGSEVYPLNTSIPPIRFVEYKRRIKDIDVDIMLSIEFSLGYLYAALNKLNIPLIIWLQDPRSEVEWKKIKTSQFIYKKEGKNIDIDKLMRNYRIAYKILNKFQNKKIFATQARFLRKRGYRKYKTKDALNAKFLPNPIHIPARIKFKDKADTPTILFLGRLDPIKRPWIFFEIAKRLPEYEFIVAGKSHDLEYMKDRILPYKNLPNLKFMGLITGEKKDYILRKSWILVNTSIHEALPVSFLEAFSYKIPVVSCQNPDGLVEKYGRFTGEILGDGYGSIGIFVRAIKELVENEKERKQLGNNARKYVEKYHTFSYFETSLKSLVKTFL